MQMTRRPSGWCSVFPVIALLILISLMSFQTACAQQRWEKFRNRD